jgi:exodeoxyribonuclease V alpha subunit
MSAYGFERDAGQWSQEAWRALDRAVYRWVLAHGGSPLLAMTAAWASLADAAGDAALALGDSLHGMTPLARADIDLLRADSLVADERSTTPRPFVIDGAERFYLWRNHADERAVAAAIDARLQRGVAAEPSDAELDALFDGARGDDVAAQRRAVRALIGRRLFVLTGAPGTGKTTTVLRMLLMLQRRAREPLAIRIAAPTGKAAQRLLQSLRQGRRALRGDGATPLPADWLPLLDAIPDEALTVHRLLGFQPWRNAFARGRDDHIAADVVVVDEASMLDLAMLRTLLDAVPDEATLILVGDADQLTSVATGSVLMDVVGALETDDQCVVRLHHSFRAANRLVALNEAVRCGDADALRSFVADEHGDIVLHRVETSRQLGDRLDQYAVAIAAEATLRAHVPTEDDARSGVVRAALVAFGRRQLLCALREDEFGSLAVNAALERLLRRAWQVGAGADWYAGRAVIITRNDYAAGLYNGDVGLCLADSHGRLRVWFETGHVPGESEAAVRGFAPAALPEHETAFAITIHKSQGSEYDQVAVLLPPEAGHRLLSRQLLYTAVSRARRGVDLWASDAALASALAHPIVRQGGLRERLGGKAAPARESPLPLREAKAGSAQLGFDF